MQRPVGGVRGHEGSRIPDASRVYKCLLRAPVWLHIKLSSSAKADDPVPRALSSHRRAGVYWIPPLWRGMTAEAPLAFRLFWPQIRAGRLAVDEPLGNRVRSGRKQPETRP